MKKREALSIISRELSENTHWAFRGRSVINDLSSEKETYTCWDRGELTHVLQPHIKIFWDDKKKKFQIKIGTRTFEPWIVKRYQLWRQIRRILNDKMISAAGYKNESAVNQQISQQILSNPTRFTRQKAIKRKVKGVLREFQVIKERGNFVMWHFKKHAYIELPGRIVVKGHRILKNALKEYEEYDLEKTLGPLIFRKTKKG